MDLDEVMVAVAEALDRNTPVDQLLHQVREALISALHTGSLAALDGSTAARLNLWLTATRDRSQNVASEIYEETLSRELRRTDQGLIVVRARQAHRITGAYYTGDDIIRYMVQRARTFLPGAASVVDPACGSGAFLAGAVRELGEQLQRVVGLDHDRTALGLCQRVVPKAHLAEVDALLGEVEGGFDLCLGNPPYISTGLRGSAPQDRDRLRALRLRYPCAGQYKLNTYPLFVERGLELLRAGGVLGYIVPDSFLSGLYFARLRRLLLSHTLLELTLIRQDFWQHGRVGQSVILFVRKGAAPPGHRVTVRVCDQVADLPSVMTAELPLSDIVWGPLDRFRLLPEQEARAFVGQMEAVAGGQSFGRLLRAYSGLIGRAGQRSLLKSGQPNKAGPWGPLLRSGREIDRYRLEWAGEHVCLAPSGIKSGGQLSFYQNPKLLMRQTADSLRAVYDDQGFYCLNNIHLLVPRTSAVNLRAVLGMINSEPVNRLYRWLTMESGRLYAQVDLDLFESLPVPMLSQGDEQQLTGLVRERESAAPNEAAQVDQRIDRCIRRCYNLT